MIKKSLYKVFYAATPQEFQAEYQSRFENEDTIHLNLTIGGYPAFICQIPELYQCMLSIERTNHKVDALCHALPEIALQQFQERCLIDEIVLTNHIEGVHSTRKEISEILQDLSKEHKRERFVGLVQKYAMLVKEERIPMETAQDIRKIYDDIFYEEIKASDPEDLPDGEIFRKSAVSVYSAAGKEIHNGVSPEEKIISMMNQSLQFLNDKSYEYLIRIAVFHYLFGYIHPFYDGNGRTSRLISSYLLSQRLNNLIGYRISYTIKEHITKYYEAFKVCNHVNNRGDLTPFVMMFLDIVDTSMKQLCASLQEKLQKLYHYVSQIPQFPNAEQRGLRELYSLLIQAALFSNIGISQKELEQHFKVSYNTVHVRLQKIPKSFLLVNRQGKRKFYLLNLSEIDKNR